MSKTPKNTAVKHGTEDLEARLAALRAEVDEIMLALAAKAEAEKADIEAKVEDAAKSAATTAEELSEEILRDARRALKQIHKQAASLEKTLGVETRANPLQTLLIAFGAGFIASLLIRR
jgi:ElaB/YqjD/DUF883 family membrane-anchored ribosome-binding protein